MLLKCLRAKLGKWTVGIILVAGWWFFFGGCGVNIQIPGRDGVNQQDGGDTTEIKTPELPTSPEQKNDEPAQAPDGPLLPPDIPKQPDGPVPGCPPSAPVCPVGCNIPIPSQQVSPSFLQGRWLIMQDYTSSQIQAVDLQLCQTKTIALPKEAERCTQYIISPNTPRFLCLGSPPKGSQQSWLGIYDLPTGAWRKTLTLNNKAANLSISAAQFVSPLGVIQLTSYKGPGNTFAGLLRYHLDTLSLEELPLPIKPRGLNNNYGRTLSVGGGWEAYQLLHNSQPNSTFPLFLWNPTSQKGALLEETQGRPAKQVMASSEEIYVFRTGSSKPDDDTLVSYNTSGKVQATTKVPSCYGMLFSQNAAFVGCATQTSLYRFERKTLKVLPPLTLPATQMVLKEIIGDKAYFSSKDGLYKLDLRSPSAQLKPLPLPQNMNWTGAWLHSENDLYGAQTPKVSYRASWVSLTASTRQMVFLDLATDRWSLSPVKLPLPAIMGRQTELLGLFQGGAFYVVEAANRTEGIRAVALRRSDGVAFLNRKVLGFSGLSTPTGTGRQVVTYHKRRYDDKGQPQGDLLHVAHFGRYLSTSLQVDAKESLRQHFSNDEYIVLLLQAADTRRLSIYAVNQ